MSDETEAAPRARKSPGAYRTISEVADDLQVPQHVLRFWETKFPQIRPLKRGGGRRYYRPEDIQLLRRISDLLYVQGYTIKGVQRLLRDGGAEAAPEADETESEPPEGEAPVAARPQLALPGMADPEPPAPAPKPVVRVRAESAAASRPAEAPGPPDATAADREIARLRGLLAEVQSELVEVRALLARAAGKTAQPS